MKRLCIIILPVSLTFALCACGSPFKAACKLLDEGKYDEAITAFEQLEQNEQVEEKLAHARQMKFQQEYDKACKLLDEEKYDEAISILGQLEKNELVEMKLSQAKDAKYRVIYADYFGEWVTAGQDVFITINDDKTGIIVNYQEEAFCFDYGNDCIQITIPEKGSIHLETFCGVPSLKVGAVRFFRIDDVQRITEEVELTPDNFWEYFEIGPEYEKYVKLYLDASDISYNGLKELDIPELFITNDIVVNEKYIGRYVPSKNPNITATFRGKWKYYDVSLNGEEYNIKFPGKEINKSENAEIRAYCTGFPDLNNTNKADSNHYYLGTKEKYTPASSLYFRCSGFSNKGVYSHTNFRVEHILPTEVVKVSGRILLYKKALQ